jgi:hypothetical protein
MLEQAVIDQRSEHIQQISLGRVVHADRPGSIECEPAREHAQPGQPRLELIRVVVLRRLGTASDKRQRSDRVRPRERSLQDDPAAGRTAHKVRRLDPRVPEKREQVVDMIIDRVALHGASPTARVRAGRRSAPDAAQPPRGPADNGRARN